MEKEGYCKECFEIVRLLEDGGCKNGHPASSITNQFNVSGPADSSNWQPSKIYMSDEDAEVYKDEKIRQRARDEVTGQQYSDIAIMLGVLGLLGVGTLVLSPVAIIFGFLALHKGNKGWGIGLGIAGLVIAPIFLTIVFRLFL